MFKRKILIIFFLIWGLNNFLLNSIKNAATYETATFGFVNLFETYRIFRGTFCDEKLLIAYVCLPSFYLLFRCLTDTLERELRNSRWSLKLYFKFFFVLNAPRSRPQLPVPWTSRKLKLNLSTPLSPYKSSITFIWENFLISIAVCFSVDYSGIYPLGILCLLKKNHHDAFPSNVAICLVVKSLAETIFT